MLKKDKFFLNIKVCVSSLYIGFILGRLIMINLNTNYGLFASKAANEPKGAGTAMERLSSGMRINYAKDDAAGSYCHTINSRFRG